MGEVWSMRLSIIIVNFNTLSYLKDCLSNLHSLALPFDFETIVVDNGSVDGSQEWLKTQSRCKYILSSENLGFAKGNNLAIKEAKGEYILLLNTDAFPQKGSIERLIDFLDTHKQVGVAGPRLNFPDGRWQRGYNIIPSVKKAWMVLFTDVQNICYLLIWSTIDKLNHKLSHKLNHKLEHKLDHKLSLARYLGLTRPKQVGYVDGCCMMIKREVIGNIGLLDESFFFFVEDAEFCYRAKQKGYGVYYLPDAHVIHIRGGSSAQKDLEKAVKFRREAEKLFIVRTFGENAWARYSGIMYGNFFIRYRIARFLNRSSQHYFSCALKEFSKESRRD